MRTITRLLLTLTLLLSLAGNALAQVPYYKPVVDEMFRATKHNLRTQEGAGLFTEDVAARLFQMDPNIGHLRKQAPRTRCGNPAHACDVLLYLATGQIIDILRDAGGPNVGPTWNVGPFGEYGQPDWMGPAVAEPIIPPGVGQPGPTPVLPPAFPSAEILQKLDALSARVLQLEHRHEQTFQETLTRIAAVDERIRLHDAEPGYLKKIFGNRYVQIVGAALLTKFGLPALTN